MSTFNHRETGKQAIYLTKSTEKSGDPNKILVNGPEDMPDIDYMIFEIPPELASRGGRNVHFYFSSLIGQESFTIWFFPSGFPGNATPWIKK